MEKPDYLKIPICPECNKNKALWDIKLETFIICEDCQKTILHKPVIESYVPLRYKNASIYDFPKTLIKQIQKDSDNFTKNIVLYGTCGKGKTYLLTAIINYLQKPTLFYTYCDLMIKIQDSINNGTYIDIIDKAKTINYLILDDIYADKKTEAKMAMVFQIINHRYNENLPTFVTFNGELKDLEDTDERVARRLLEDNAVFKLSKNYKYLK